MPTPEEILASLERIANSAFVLAIFWHILVVAGFAAVIAGWRPSCRLARLMLAAPTASVSVLAWLHGNPFNGAVFTVLFLA